MPHRPIHPTYRRTWNSNGMIDLEALAANATKPEDIIGESLPQDNLRVSIGGEKYIRATDKHWAAYQVELISPFNITKSTTIKQTGTLTYRVGFAFFA